MWQTFFGDRCGEAAIEDAAAHSETQQHHYPASPIDASHRCLPCGRGCGFGQGRSYGFARFGWNMLSNDVCRKMPTDPDRGASGSGSCPDERELSESSQNLSTNWRCDTLRRTILPPFAWPLRPSTMTRPLADPPDTCSISRVESRGRVGWSSESRSSRWALSI